MVLQLYAADRAPELLGAALSLAEAGLLAFRDSYDLLRAVERPVSTTRSIIGRHSNRLGALSTTEARCEFVTTVCDAESEGVEDDLVALYDSKGMLAVQVYNRLGRGVLQLAEEIGPETVELLTERPDLFDSLKRYGKPAHRFVEQYGEIAADKLVQGSTWDLDNVLSEDAQPIIQAWYQERKDLEIVNVLVIDWPIIQYVQRYDNDLKPIWIWLALRRQTRVQRPTSLMAQYEKVLFDVRYDYTQLISLVGKVQPQALETVASKFYQELLAYRGTEERIRFCKVLTETLNFAKDARRYVKSSRTVGRAKLLRLVEVIGRPLLDLLDMLHSKAQATVISRMLALKSEQLRSYVTSLLYYRNWFALWSEPMQIKVIQATSHQHIKVVAQAWHDYGDAGVDEIIKSGKLGFFFKLTHRRRS